MTENKDLKSRLVIGAKRDGRREYDEAARDELVFKLVAPQLREKSLVVYVRTILQAFAQEPTIPGDKSGRVSVSMLAERLSA